MFDAKVLATVIAVPAAYRGACATYGYGFVKIIIVSVSVGPHYLQYLITKICLKTARKSTLGMLF